MLGDIVGSVYELDDRFRSKDFPLFTDRSHFTDDTILTIATADAQMTDWDYAGKYRECMSAGFQIPEYGGGRRAHSLGGQIPWQAPFTPICR